MKDKQAFKFRVLTDEGKGLKLRHLAVHDNQAEYCYYFQIVPRLIRFIQDDTLLMSESHLTPMGNILYQEVRTSPSRCGVLRRANVLPH